MRRLSLSYNKQFEKHFCILQGEWLSLSSTFNDFLELTVCSFVRDEEIYEMIKKKYTQKQFDLFPDMIADLINIEQEKNEKGVVSDYIWEFYMQFITWWELGQYFTPTHVSDFIAEIVKDDSEEYSVLNRKSVNDCACGSGRNLLWWAKKFWQRNIYAIWQDLDRRCCLMAYINLVLSNIDGEIRQWDTIKYDFTDWRSFKLWWWQIPICRKITELPKYKPQEKEEKQKVQSLFDL